MRLTDCTSAGGSPPRPGAAGAPAAPRTSSSTARDTSGEPAEAGATSVFKERLHLEPLDPGQRLELASRLGAPWPPCHITASSRVFALPSCRYGPESRSPHNGGRFAALGLLGRVVGDEERSPIEDGRRAESRGGVIPRNSTTRPPGVEERRRAEEQEEEQDHRRAPGFARPIILLPLVRPASVFCAGVSQISSYTRPANGHV